MCTTDVGSGVGKGAVHAWQRGLAVCLVAGGMAVGQAAWAEEQEKPVAEATPVVASTEAQEAPPAGLDDEMRDHQLRPRTGGGYTPELDVQDIDEALQVLRDYRPELVERFEDWARRNPQSATRMLARNVPFIARLIRQRREDPQGYRLTIQDMRLFRVTGDLSRQVRLATAEGDQDKANQLTQRLEQVVARHFDVRQKIREREIQKLEQRLEQLRNQMELRTQARDRIIHDRLEKMTDDDGKSTW